MYSHNISKCIIYLPKDTFKWEYFKQEDLLQVCFQSPMLLHILYWGNPQNKNPTRLRLPETLFRGLKIIEPCSKNILISMSYQRGRRQDIWPMTPEGRSQNYLHSLSLTEPSGLQPTFHLLPSNSTKPLTTPRCFQISARIWNHYEDAGIRL